jgi:hypothetical protein
MHWLAGGLLVGRYVLRKLGLGQFIVPNVVPHPMGFANQSLVGKPLRIRAMFTQRHHQTHSDFRCVQCQQLQHRLNVAVVGANDDLITVAWSMSTILTARRQLSWPVEAGNELVGLFS